MRSHSRFISVILSAIISLTSVSIPVVQSKINFGNIIASADESSPTDITSESENTSADTIKTVDFNFETNNSLPYTGKEQECPFKSNDNYIISDKLEGISPEIDGTANQKDVGKYTVTASLKEGFNWSDGSTNPKELNWSITPVNLGEKNDTKVVTNNENIVFTLDNAVQTIGEISKPTINTLTYNGNDMSADVVLEYYSYSDNGWKRIIDISKNGAGKYKVVAEGITENVTGYAVSSTEFEIKAKSLDDFEIKNAENIFEITYDPGATNGSIAAAIGDLIVIQNKTDNTKTLKKDTDFEIGLSGEITDHDTVAKTSDGAEFTVNGIGEYFGSSITGGKFKMIPKEITDEMVIIPPLNITGYYGNLNEAELKKESVGTILLKDISDLIKDRDYTVLWQKENLSISEINIVEISGIGNYCGKIEKNVNVAGKEITIKYDPGTGAEDDSKYFTEAVKYGENNNKIAENPFIGKIGSSFLNWTDGKNTYEAGAEILDSDSTFWALNNIALTAQWSNDPIITFDFNDEKTDSVTVSATGAEGEKKINSPEINITAPTRSGYTFAGWCKENNLSDIPIEGSKLYEEIFTGSTRLYAKWIADKYNVTLSNSSENHISEVVSDNETARLGNNKAEFGQNYSVKIKADDNYLLPDSISVKIGTSDAAEIISGTENNGISYDSSTGIIFIPDFKINGDIIIAAKAEIKKFTAEFIENYNENNAEEIQNNKADIQYGTKINAPDLPTAPDNKIFAGWYKGILNENKIILGDRFDFENEIITGNITLYAKWDDKIEQKNNIENTDIFGEKICIEADYGTADICDRSVNELKIIIDNSDRKVEQINNDLKSIAEAKVGNNKLDLALLASMNISLVPALNNSAWNKNSDDNAVIDITLKLSKAPVLSDNEVVGCVHVSDSTGKAELMDENDVKYDPQKMTIKIHTSNGLSDFYIVKIKKIKKNNGENSGSNSGLNPSSGSGSGWSPNIPSSETYTITWNIDGVKNTEKITENTTPNYTGNIPAKQEDDNYTYIFKGWDKPFAPVHSNVIYTALFEAIPKIKLGTVTNIKISADGTITWDKAENAACYKVEKIVNGRSYFSKEITENICKISAPDTEYFVRIYAFDSTDKKIRNKTVSKIVQFKFEEVGKVSNIKISSDRKTISWSAADNATSYKIEKIIGNKKYYSGEITGTSYTLKNTVNSEFKIRIIAINKISKKWSSIKKIPAKKLETVINPTISPDGTISWSKAYGAVSYNVGKIIGNKVYYIKNIKTNSAKFKSVPKGDYKVFIEAVDKNGNKTIGNQIKITTAAKATNVTIAEDGKTVTWNKVIGAKKYQLVKVVNGKKYYSEKTTDTAAEFSNAVKNGTYIYVITFDKNNRTSYSDAVCVD